MVDEAAQNAPNVAGDKAVPRDTHAAPPAPPRSGFARLSAAAALAFGVLSVLAWVGGLVALFANMDTDETGLAATVVLLALVVLSAIATIPAKSPGTVVAVLGALLYGGLWTYLRFGFDRMMPDAILTVITVLFFITPLVTGITASVVGARRIKA